MRAVVTVLLLIACTGLLHAATPAGTIIKNQASASYRDAGGVVRYTTSNIVETLIQQVAAIQLTQDQSRPVVAGRQIYLPHTLTNAGNGADTFNLQVQNTASDDFDLTGLTLYEDADQNGQPDVFVPLTVTPSLAMHESFSFVVAAQVPAGTPANNTAELRVEAGSEFNNVITAANTDAVVVSDGAVIEVTKRIAATAGNSPDGPFTVTLSYRNIGNAEAVDLTLIDALPAGMEYIASTAKWSVTGDLIHSDGNSAHGDGSDPFLTYCAYSATCSGFAEADADVDSDSTNQVTAIVSTVAPGESGQLTFDVQIADGLSASAIFNTAEFEYTTNAVVSPRQTSNTVGFNVLHQPAVVLNGSASDATNGVDEPLLVLSIAQGTAVQFTDIVWNTGNDTDTFDITFDRAASTFPEGSLFRLLQPDGMTPLLDSNGNGIPDTGPVPASASYAVVLQVIPPANVSGDNAANGYEISLQATSMADVSVVDSMLNRLTTITTSAVDITNVAALPDSDATGVGAGPEVDPVTVFNVAPGATVPIVLFVNNTGASTVSLDLAASTEADFSVLTLPDGWLIEYRLDGDDASAINTGPIEAGAHQLVKALVTLPADAPPGELSLYFRAMSELTGAVDIKHEQIAVSELQQVLLELDQSGQTNAGGAYLYHHTLSNGGNAVVNDISLNVSDNVSGWNSIVYEDTNNNGTLDSSDPAVSAVGALNPGDTRTIFVKVFAPSGAAVLTSNRTTLTASWAGGASSTHNVDTTTVVEIEISIVKEQAPDFGCTGSPDSAYGVGGFAVEPGNNCVSYRLTATNAGQATAFNVEIADATPAFTEYFGTALCSHDSCTVQEPQAGGQGNVVATIPALDAGDVVMLNFSVRVE
jgi:uncharacterized repeat protein (TIGR01451 family)